MTQPSLLEMAERTPLADTSLMAYDRLLPTLAEREIEMFLRVADFLERTGYPDVTGGELAEATGVPVTSVRPRLCGLIKKGWLHSGESRTSRVRELRSHPVSLAVPREAIERARNTVKKAAA